MLQHRSPKTLSVVEFSPNLYGHVSLSVSFFLICSGRDIALSENQSPVLKFYDTMYDTSNGENDESSNGHGIQQQLLKYKTPENIQGVRAIQLWNDWNIQVEEYLKLPSSHIEYMTMRSEDLLNKETRFDALRALSEFIGSPAPPQELCCMVYEGTKDYGQSSVHQQMRGRRGKRPPGETPQIVNQFKEWEHTPKRNVNPNEEMMRKLNSHGNDLNAGNHQRRRLSQMVTDEEDPGGLGRIEVDETESFLKGFADYKQVVEHQGKAMQIEQLEEWIDRGQYLKSQLNQIRSSNPTFDDQDEYLLEIQSSLDTLQTYWKRKETIAEGGDSTNNNPQQQQQRRGAPKRIQNVHKRYGKWQQLLETNPELSRFLHEEGKDGLEMFGYEPLKQFSYHPPTPTAVADVDDELFVCTKEVSVKLCNAEIDVM